MSHVVRVEEYRLGWLAECSCQWLSGYWNERLSAVCMGEVHESREAA